VPGSRVGSGQVAEVAVTGDRVVVSVSGDGSEVAGVEVVRFDPSAPPPPARAGGLALYLRTDTRGGLTPAWQFALAEALAGPMTRATWPRRSRARASARACRFTPPSCDRS